jgi:hypothetical protein
VVWDLIVYSFQNWGVLRQNLKARRDSGLIYNKLSGFFTKFVRFIEIGIISQQ